MLLWREEIKTKKEILIICFMFYFYWLNNKGKMVKLSIYNKCNFFEAWEYPHVSKEIHIFTRRG